MQQTSLFFLCLFVVNTLGFFTLTVSASINGLADLGSNHPKRQTQYGDIVGFAESTSPSFAWLGIPYAQPPVGNLRWQAPRPLTAWNDEKKTLQTGSMCRQSKATFQDPITYQKTTYVGSEDCLYLNVWSPTFTPDAIPAGDDRLPVMVWIHGGGNVRGHGGYIPGGKLASSQNVIVVSMNYRLGPFGWLSNESLRKQAATPADASGNFGTLDIIQALEWVQDNISVFGGNPDNVTIFGTSAGGWNVYSLLNSPRATGLFHRAIMQSAWPTTVSRQQAENFMDDPAHAGHPQSSNELLVQLLQQDNKANDRQSAKKQLKQMQSDAIVSYLKNKTYQQIEQAYASIEEKYGSQNLHNEQDNTIKLVEVYPKNNFSVPKLINDGYVLSKNSFYTTVNQKQHNAVPIMLGTTRDESTEIKALDANFVEVVNGQLQIRDIHRYQLANDYLSKLWKAAGVDEPATALANKQPFPIFAYRFDWDNVPEREGQSNHHLYGARHGMETIFIFGADFYGFVGSPLPVSFEPLSDAMMSYWAEFAYHGNPGRGREGLLPEWKPWGVRPTDKEKMIIFDDAASGGITMSSEQANKQAVLKQIADDPRIDTNAERCQLYQDLLHHMITFLTLAEYTDIAMPLCAESAGTNQ